MNVPLDDQRLLARFYFPLEWAATDRDGNGQRRRRRQKSLRTRAVARAIMASFPVSASCSNCKGYEDGICLWQSDFYGKQPVKPTHLCEDWTCRTT